MRYARPKDSSLLLLVSVEWSRGVMDDFANRSSNANEFGRWWSLRTLSPLASSVITSADPLASSIASLRACGSFGSIGR